MRMTTIPGIDLRVSRFIFGTGGLLNAGTATSRRRLLFAALDAGFTHFDTAPYYGFGLAERDLAEVLKARPAVTFTTKVGLYPPGGADQRVSTVLARKILGRAFRSLSRPLVDLSVSTARQSLEGSLRRTGRERIDLFLLHDPVVRLLETEEWRNWLDCCVSQGKIRHFGMALSADVAVQFLDTDATIGSVIQIRDSIDGREADVLDRYGRAKQITFGYVSAARLANPRCCVLDVLRNSLFRNPNGGVIVTTKRLGRLQQYADLAESSTHDRRLSS